MMAKDLHIRELQPQDADQVVALSHQLGYERTPAQILAWITTRNASQQVVYVACRAEEVLGWIEISIVNHLQSDRHTLIGGLVVKDGTRGLGIGRMLCEQAESWTLSQQLTTIRVTSRSTRKDAHRFYLRDGYEEIKTSAVFEKHPERNNRAN
jgi:GNAT superfamily N-acetyltransferase